MANISIINGQVYVDGKAVKPNQENTKNDKDIKTIDSIAAGETFEHNGPVIVTNGIGAGATVKIQDGCITVRGLVGDSVRIKTDGENDSGNVNVISGNGVTVVSGSNSIVVSQGSGSFNNTFTQSSAPDHALTGIQLDGSVGDDVTLVANNGDVRLNSNSGKNLAAQASRDIKVYETTKQSSLNAARDIKLTDAEDATLNAARDVKGGDVLNANISAGRDVKLDSIEGTGSINAGRDLKAFSCAATVSTTAGRKIKITQKAQSKAPQGDNNSRFDF